MMKFTGLMIMLTMIVFVPILYSAEFPHPVVTLLGDIQGGSGTYMDPYVLYTDYVEWRLDETYGDNRESVIYSTTIKMSHHRSCAPVIKFKDMSWSDLQGQVFRWDDGVCGIYHIDLTVEKDGEEEDTKLFFYLKIPPVKSFSLPYKPPGNNHKSDPEATFLNMYGGGGSYNDPYLLDGPFIRFKIDKSQDPDGHSDIKYGVTHWAIYTEGQHPMYSSQQQGERDPEKTFLYWDDIDGTVFEWDTRLRPSEDHAYKFVLIVYDQWGEHVEKNWHFYYDPQNSNPPSVSKLIIHPEKLDFGIDQDAMDFEITNTGTARTDWSAEITSGDVWIKSINPSGGTIHSGLTTNVTVLIDRSKLNEGEHKGEIVIQSENDTKKVALKLQVDLPPGSPGNIVVVMP